MTNGTVMWFDIRKGLGFIEPDDGSAGTFVTDLAVERAVALRHGRRGSPAVEQ